MLKLLERNIASIEQRLVLLAPPQAAILPDHLGNITTDAHSHRRLLRELQRLRGQIYLADGALTPEQLSSDGRHETPEDDKSWHLMVLDSERRVSGCIWYLEHEGTPSIDELRVRHSPLAHEPEWGDKLGAAVRSEVAGARREGVAYAEVGGWAVS